MSTKRTKPTPLPSRAVSLERAPRLYRLIRLLGTGPQTRAAVLKKLRIDIRTFYRDLELLRMCGIEVPLTHRKYALAENGERVLARLPVPDPSLTLGEAIILAKGRTAVHLKLRRLIKEITG